MESFMLERWEPSGPGVTSERDSEALEQEQWPRTLEILIFQCSRHIYHIASDLLPSPGCGVGHRLTLCGRQMGRTPEAVGGVPGGAGRPSPRPLPPV